MRGRRAKRASIFWRVSGAIESEGGALLDDALGPIDAERLLRTGSTVPTTATVIPPLRATFSGRVSPSLRRDSCSRSRSETRTLTRREIESR